MGPQHGPASGNARHIPGALRPGEITSWAQGRGLGGTSATGRASQAPLAGRGKSSCLCAGELGVRLGPESWDSGCWLVGHTECCPSVPPGKWEGWSSQGVLARVRQSPGNSVSLEGKTVVGRGPWGCHASLSVSFQGVNPLGQPWVTERSRGSSCF